MTAPGRPPVGTDVLSRTEFAWERSTFGFLAVAVFAGFRQHGGLSVAHLVLAVGAVALAVTVAVIGRRRRTAVRAALSEAGATVGGAVGGAVAVVPDARREVRLVGTCVVAFAVVSGVVLLW